MKKRKPIKMKNGDMRLILVYKHKGGILITGFSQLHRPDGQVIRGDGK